MFDILNLSAVHIRAAAEQHWENISNDETFREKGTFLTRLKEITDR